MRKAAHISGVAGLVLAALALPALADEGQTSCWDLTRPPGIFDWNASPSVACRDSAEAAPPTLLPQPGPRTPEPQTAADRSETSITFSGNAYVGVGFSF